MSLFSTHLFIDAIMFCIANISTSTFARLFLVLLIKFEIFEIVRDTNSERDEKTKVEKTKVKVTKKSISRVKIANEREVKIVEKIRKVEISSIDDSFEFFNKFSFFMQLSML